MIASGTLPVTVVHLPIAEDEYRTGTPRLYLDGHMSPAPRILEDIGLDVVRVDDDDVRER